MGFWNIFSTSDKAVELGVKAGEGLISGIDKMFYTDEEKADMRKATGLLWIDMQKVLVGESSLKSLSRRYLAWMLTAGFITLVMQLACMLWLKHDSAEDMWQLVQYYGYFEGAVIFFYFSVHVATGVINKLKGK